jgi:hypothetical protein
MGAFRGPSPALARRLPPIVEAFGQYLCGCGENRAEFNVKRSTAFVNGKTYDLFVFLWVFSDFYRFFS